VKIPASRIPDDADPRPDRHAEHRIRTPVGLKIQGADLDKIQEIGQQTEKLLSAIPGRATCSPERVGEGFFLDVTWDRQALARYGFPSTTRRTLSRRLWWREHQHQSSRTRALPRSMSVSPRFPVRSRIAEQVLVSTNRR